MKTSNRRIALLTGASFSAIGLTMVAASPAQAACTVTGTIIVCDPTTTTDTVYPANVPNDRAYSIGQTAVTVTTGSLVQGYGLAFDQTAAGYTVTNNGTVQVNTGLTPTAGNDSGALLMYYNLGPVTYTGPGNVIHLGTGPALQFKSYIGSTGSVTATVGGSVRAENGDAIQVLGGNAVSGNVAITTTAGQTVRASGGDGIDVDIAGSGNVTITNAAVIRSADVGVNTLEDGIEVTSTGTGNITINNTGSIGAAAIAAVVGPPAVPAVPADFAQGHGILAEINNAASAGTISVTGSGVIRSVDDGIEARTNGTGAVTVNYTGAINILSTGFGDGIEAETTSGLLTVTTGAGAITAADDGIDAFSTTGNQVITAGGNITGVNNGILANSTSGAIAVNVNGGNVTATAAAGDGIDVNTAGAKTITIAGGPGNPNRTVTGGTTGAAIEVGGGGLATINNNGIVGTAGAARIAVQGNAGTQVIFNNNADATLNGRVLLAELADTINNANIWNMAGANVFGAGVDTINNLATGVINTATGTTVDGLEIFNNSGDINVTGTLAFTGFATALTNNASGEINLNPGATVTGLGPIVNNGYLGLGLDSVINGTSYTQGPGGTVEFELDADFPGDRPQIIVAGNAALDGTLLANIHSANGLFGDTTTFQDVIDGATQTGTFDVCAISGTYANSAFLDLTCVYSPAAGAGNVDLVLTRTAFDLVDTGNLNGNAVAGGLECIYDPDLEDLPAEAFAELLAMDAVQFADAANQLGGAGYASYMNSFNSLGVHYNDIIAKATDCEIPALAGSVLECRTAPTHMWVQVDFQNRRTDGDLEAAGYRADRWTALLGFDISLGNAAILGISAGKVTNRLDVQDDNNLFKADGYQLGGYAVFDPGTFFIKGVGTYNWFDGDAVRRINFVPLGGTIQGTTIGDPDIKMWTIGAHAGMRFGMGATSVLTPYLNVDYTNIRMQGFNETGDLALIGLDVNSAKETRTTATGGIKWAGQFGGVVPELNLGYRHQFGDRRSSFNAFFGDEGCDFDIVSEADKRGSWLAGASVGGRVGPLDVRVSYEGLFNNQSRSHAGNFKLVMPFGRRAEVVEAAPAPYVAPPPPPAPEPYVAPPPPPPAPSGERG